MNLWQPIETAIKDDTSRLLYFPDAGMIEGWWFSSPKEIDDGWETINGSLGNPTHWMPLPEEPEKDRPTNSSPRPNAEESDLALIRRAMGVMFQGWMIHMQTNPECTGKGPAGRPCEPIDQCWCKNEITQHIEIAKRRERHER